MSLISATASKLLRTTLLTSVISSTTRLPAETLPNTSPFFRLGTRVQFTLSQYSPPPARAWNASLWLSSTGFLIIGGWTIWQKLGDVAAGVFGG